MDDKLKKIEPEWMRYVFKGEILESAPPEIKKEYERFKEEQKKQSI